MVPAIMSKVLELLKVDSTLLVVGTELVFANTSSEETTTDPLLKNTYNRTINYMSYTRLLSGI